MAVEIVANLEWNSG